MNFTAMKIKAVIRNLVVALLFGVMAALISEKWATMWFDQIIVGVVFFVMISIIMISFDPVISNIKYAEKDLRQKEINRRNLQLYDLREE